MNWGKIAFFLTHKSTYLFLGGIQAYCIYNWYYTLNRMFKDDFYPRLGHIIFLNIMMLWSHIIASYSDPGYIIATIPQKGDVVCKKCSAVRNERSTHHCSKCGRCVLMMDHHCYWTNNCVSKNTFKPFVCFCFWTIMFAFYGVITQIQFYYTTNQIYNVGI
jgi:hypothetical protein